MFAHLHLLTSVLTALTVIVSGALLLKLFAGKDGLPLVFDARLFLRLLPCFLIFPTVISITHESGHYIAARLCGHRHPHIHYSSTDTGRNELLVSYRTLLRKNRTAIDRGQPFPDQLQFRRLSASVDSLLYVIKASHYNSNEVVLVSAAGPAVAMIVGTIGLALLYRNKKKYIGNVKVLPSQWLVFFTALFWIEPFYTFVSVIIRAISNPDWITDEAKIAIHYGLWPWTINGATGIVGLVFTIVLFTYMPAKLRLTILASGFAGGVPGFILWQLVGPVLLP